MPKSRKLPPALKTETGLLELVCKAEEQQRLEDRKFKARIYGLVRVESDVYSYIHYRQGFLDATTKEEAETEFLKKIGGDERKPELISWSWCGDSLICGYVHGIEEYMEELAVKRYREGYRFDFKVRYEK